ncbi:nitroreductase family protein [Actinoplanes couchii]|uniref:NADPH-dependent oxidoreductase n=1 Tax=Actinoplanes couchii TaxID=403638 RepID=A0ABQ3XGU9_9ACTN|nr:nitroreductase family protein [Actinoplanes couchii]MDR6320806.1 nitroreductase [Actinoplanes couchii]GID57709.1 NADPH-dependent oxidoreductase [Actinoplanes couchii]
MTNELLNSRYGTQDQPANLIWNDHTRQLLGHRSVRAYLPDPLPDGALETMVAAAQSASSSSNLHHWSVIAVTDPAVKRELTRLSSSDYFGSSMPFVQEAPAILLWVADNSRNHAVATALGVEPVSLDYLDALVMATADTAIAAQNAVVAAEAMGLGVCYLGAMRNRARELADLVRLPPYSFVVFGLAVGRPDPARSADIRPRPAQSVVLHHDRYDATRGDGWLGEYETATRRFRAESGMRERSWAESVVVGTGRPYLDGRENLRRMVEKQGYRLG